jgi:site-specific DNA-methyltransferase (cytosine-N4-specific)
MTVAQAALDRFFSELASATDKRAHVHGAHPYPAKFIPHIPRELIMHLSDAGDVVLDPMCGSGTTVVEASLHERISIGTDINPVALLASQAKTVGLKPTDLAQLDALSRRVDAHRQGEHRETPPIPRDFPNRDHWFQEDVACDIEQVLGWIDSMTDESARVTARCALSAVIVRASRQDSETRWAAIAREVPPGFVHAQFSMKLSDLRARQVDYAAHRPAASLILRADARALPLSDDSVDCVVTSPPYANSHDYYLYNKLRMFWLGENVAQVQDQEFGSRNKHSDKKLDVHHYLSSMRAIFAETRRVVRGGGRAAFVVADAVIRGEFFDMHHMLDEEAVTQGLSVFEYYSFGHKEFTSAFQRNFGTLQKKHTHVLVYQVD